MFIQSRCISTAAVLAFAVMINAGASAPSLAQTVTHEGRVGIASQYTGKGLGKSDEEPAVFGQLQAGLRGFYVSAFASEAASSKGADAEVILAGGWAGDVAGFDVDAQVMHREMVGEVAGYDSAYWEYQADVSHDLGRGLSARLRLNYSPDGYGPSQQSWWVEGQVTARLTSKDKLSGALASRTANGGADYNAWNIGVKHRFTSAIAGDLRWHDTDSHDLGDRYDGRLVAALTYSF